ncbi:head maturation protease, ClpP-related [Tateyamaria sp. syn59]|uniref:head maturation protease, ClpP-related n=1 Tax=Tateyamaria sp. syn59 TaxID=2576942 RepID=UPI0011BEE8EB|nr:head maturation protease, ClpP-related [Tateyamaria sp. syn59]
MTIRDLPKADLSTKPGANADLTVEALDRWNPSLSVSAENNGENSISVLDPIGGGFFYEGVTAKRVAAALRNIGEGPVTVNVNSPGGDFFEGLAIYNLLREHPGEVTVKVLGIAASAASAIAMAGDEILIARAGFFMIHNTQVCACGDRNALADVATWLEPFDAALSDIYAARTGIDAAEIAPMLDRETWIGGARAVQDGFADDLLPSDYVATEQSGDEPTDAKRATAKMDVLMAKLQIPRSERRSMIAAMKEGTPGAAPASTPSAAGTGKQDAALMAGLGGLLAKLS